MFQYELHAAGEQAVRFEDRTAVEDFFAAFEILIPDVVFKTLQPGVPFIIRLKVLDRETAFTLYAVAPLDLAYRPIGRLARPPAA